MRTKINGDKEISRAAFKKKDRKLGKKMLK
jgi:hypothetical protein